MRSDFDPRRVNPVASRDAGPVDRLRLVPPNSEPFVATIATLLQELGVPLPQQFHMAPAVVLPFREAICRAMPIIEDVLAAMQSRA